MIPLICSCIATTLLAYLWHCNRAISIPHPEASKVAQKTWTKEQIQDAYRKAQESFIDVKPYLFSKKNRRYIVTGGSGLVGGWIVQHLLLRGEDPRAIRIVDVNPPKRPEIVEHGVEFMKTDISDPEAVGRAFAKPWKREVRSLPLTVFHCAAIISPSDRKSEFLPKYKRVNIDGTRNALGAARTAGASVFVVTSSGSVGLKPVTYFPWPWQRWPKHVYQFLPNADRENLDDPLDQFPACYAFTKAQAEKMVRDANNPKANFLTGAIRPGHAIYGHGIEQSSSVTWDYLHRGGSPTWISEVTAHFVCAQNVSVGHLAFEDALLKLGQTVAGNGYLVTDPNPPIRYGDCYRSLMILAHPLTKPKFPIVPHIVMLLLAYVVEAYQVFVTRYAHFLPKLTGDITFNQPAMFNLCTVHLIYDDRKAQDEIGYKAPIQTIDGFAEQVVWWNERVEGKIKNKLWQGKGGETKVVDATAMPKPPIIH